MLEEKINKIKYYLNKQCQVVFHCKQVLQSTFEDMKIFVEIKISEKKLL